MGMNGQHTLPEGWKVVPLSQVARVQTGVAKNSNLNGNTVSLPYLRVANVQDGRLDLREIKQIRVRSADVSKYQIQIGDVLFTEGGDFDKLGRCVVWSGQVPGCLHQNHVFVVRTNPDLLDPHYLSFLSASPYGRAYFLHCAKQTTNLASINSSQLKSFPLLLPPLAEQRAISRVLSAWANGEEVCTRLLETKTRFRVALHHQLLSGQRRTSDSAKGPWPRRQMGDLVDRVRVPVEVEPDREYREIGIRSHGKGVFHKEPILGSDLGDKDVYAVLSDCLTFNIVFAWEQAVAVTTAAEAGMIASHRFPMYRPRDGVLSLRYALYYLLSPDGKTALEVASPGGAGRNRTLSQEGFRKITIPLPPIEEQERIAATLTTLDREIALMRQYFDALKKQKKGLMQKLLTGQVRVQIEGEQHVVRTC